MTPLQQSPAFARALTACGADVSLSQPDGAVILQRRFAPLGRIAFASRADPRTIADTPVRLLNGETPCPRPYRAAGFRQIITPAHVADWDLTQADLRTNLHGKWRNQLRKSERCGLRIREVAWTGTAHPMFPAADALANARGFRSYPTTLLAALAQLTPNSATLFEAYDRGTLVAACLILRHGQTATYQTAWSTPTGHALQAPRAVLWAAAVRMKALRHDTFDLGVIETERAKGLARFKLGTGATPRPLGGTWIRLRAPSR
jgi:hypothetical protein